METPRDIEENIAEVEEELVKLVELEHGSKVVVNPFWVVILLDCSMKEHQGFWCRICGGRLSMAFNVWKICCVW